MDEIRVWNSARPQELIRRYMNHTLNGDEMGLKAYFPFEDVTIADPSVSNNSAVNFSADSIGVAGDGTLAEQYFALETPKMKLQRPEVLIPHDFAINDDEVVIIPAVDKAEIENQILDISIKRVKDLFGNEMEQTVTWTAFIDQNNVVWDKQKLTIEKFVEEETSVKVNIKNNGGINENYQITNIPYWMDVSPTSGVLTPQEVVELSITIKPELNIGTYTHDLNLVASTEFNERLALEIKVKGHTPDWAVDPVGYQYSANIIGQLSIGGVLSTDTEDLVGCFVEGECRGVSNVKYMEDGDIFLVFMSVYSNTPGEDMSFKVWDASTGFTYSKVTPEIVFEQDKVYGSAQAPLPINAMNYIDQELALVSGWNWVSFNVWSEDFNDLNTAFANMQKTTDDLIKSQGFFATVSSDSWIGSLTSLNERESYKLFVDASQDLVMSGYRIIADTVEIPIVGGWNWVGYPSQSVLPLMDALSSLEPSQDDVIKSQYQFAIFDQSLGWIGSLEFMEPGKGYIMYAENGGILQYSSTAAKSIHIAGPSDDGLPNTEMNMCVVAEAKTESPGIYTIATYDEESRLCGRAEAKVLTDGRTMFFLTINSTEPHSISFQAESAYDTCRANEVLEFKGNSVVGDANKPYVLTFSSQTTGLEGSYVQGFNAQVYPNPFGEELNLNLEMGNESEVALRLFNALGEKIGMKESRLPAGSHNIDILEELNLKNRLVSGVYLLKVAANQEEKIVKLTKR